MSDTMSLSNGEWKKTTIGKITTKVGSGATPRGGSNAYKNQGISLIRSQNVLDLQFSTDGLAFIDNEQADGLKNVILEKNDVLLNITGDSVARVCKVPEYLLPARVNQHVAIIRANKENAIPYYILYNLVSQKEELLMQSEIGATRKAITKGMLEEFSILLPPLPEQKAIAEVLSSLDDKIDLLHRQNQTLEQMAETLFRQWFVEEAGEGWEEGVLGDVLRFNYGKSLPKKKRTGSGYPVFGSSGITDYHAEFLVDGPGIITGRKGTLGIINYSFESFFPIDTTFYISNYRGNSNLLFDYFLLKQINLGDMNTNSAVPGLNRENAERIEIRIPPIELIFKFESTIESGFHKVKSNQAQIRTLTQLRDTLLPKLMSGEVRVKMSEP